MSPAVTAVNRDVAGEKAAGAAADAAARAVRAADTTTELARGAAAESAAPATPVGAGAVTAASCAPRSCSIRPASTPRRGAGFASGDSADGAFAFATGADADSVLATGGEEAVGINQRGTTNSAAKIATPNVPKAAILQRG